MSKEKMSFTISIKDLAAFGCPHCGFRSGRTPVRAGDTSIWECGDKECGQRSCVLADGVTTSSIKIGERHPEVQAHPRHGIPSHGNSDIRPGTGGEFFRSRGIGADRCVCFVCGTDKRNKEGNNYLQNIAAFVRCKEAGERVVAMFSCGARLDYRDFEPDYVQVKIGACDEHLENLEKLNELVKDGVITSARVSEALGGQIIDLDELQKEAEKLVALLTEREPGLMAWNMCIRERLESLHKLLSKAFSK